MQGDEVLMHFMVKVGIKQLDALRLLSAFNKVDTGRRGVIDSECSLIFLLTTCHVTRNDWTHMATG